MFLRLQIWTLAMVALPWVALGRLPCPPPARASDADGGCGDGWDSNPRGCCLPTGPEVILRGRRVSSLKSPLALQARRPFSARFVPLPGGATVTGLGDDAAFDLADWVVEVAPFDIGRSEVTVAEYAACVRAGVCAEPGAQLEDEAGATVEVAAGPAEDDAVEPTSSLCNWGHPGRANLPINCLSWAQAARFAAWAGARLPAEIEWIHAARGGGSQETPWAGGRAQRNQELGFFYLSTAAAPVCSFPASHSVQGVCDLLNNVGEMVAQPLVRSVADAKTPALAGESEANGPASEAPSERWSRGGNFFDGFAQVDFFEGGSGSPSESVGFRLARCRLASAGGRVGSKKKTMPACACPTGQVNATAGRVSACCWPGQTWSWQESSCAGEPQCPEGMKLQKFDPLSLQPFPAPTCLSLPAIEAAAAERSRREAAGQVFAQSLAFVPVLGGELTAAPITVDQYGACVKAGACSPRRVSEGHPPFASAPDAAANAVGFKQALAFARWAGGQLPSLNTLKSLPTSADGSALAEEGFEGAPFGGRLALWTRDPARWTGNEARTHDNRVVATVPSGVSGRVVVAAVGNPMGWVGFRVLRPAEKPAGTSAPLPPTSRHPDPARPEPARPDPAQSQASEGQVRPR